MKNVPSLRTSLFSIGVLCALSAFVSSAQAQIISTPNLFLGKAVAPSTYNYGTAAGITDGTTAYGDPGIDGEAASYVNISGFNSDIDTIKIYSSFPNSLRFSPGVIIYYSANLVTSVNPGDYDAVLNGGSPLTLAYAPSGDAYINPTNPIVYSPTYPTSPISYDVLSGLNIPTGTQSILFNFSKAGGQYVPEINEIQGFSAVPEPSTVLLSAIGVAFMFFRVARSRRVVA